MSFFAFACQGKTSLLLSHYCFWCRGLRRWAGREKVALISFGYQNIFATSVSFDSGKKSTLKTSGEIAFKVFIRFSVLISKLLKYTVRKTAFLLIFGQPL